MKILHCADLHMDSPMETHMTREQAAKRNAEILMSFQRMTEYAENENVRVVLIAGDLFDGERVTRRTVEGVLDAEELQGAKAVLSAAALTYLASVISSALQLLRLILISRSRNRD